MSLTIVDRFHPQRRATLQTAVAEGRLRKVDELALLDPEQILPLARLSLWLFGLSGIFFIVLNLAAYIWRTGHHGASTSGGQILLWALINLASYVVILPIHELLHGLAILFWGGRPHYGAKLPLALYCGAKDQIFPRDYYQVIALVPLVVITLAGVIFTLLAPALSPYVLLATVGNVAGAAGDLEVARRVRVLPSSALIEDQETGYSAWVVTPTVEPATIDATS
jgi:hypothetical protein